MWEGRHKASLVDAAEYLLTCYSYIELNPVRASMVPIPEAYRWSSYAWHGLDIPDRLIRDHAIYDASEEDPTECRWAYGALFAGHLAPDTLHRLCEANAHNYPLGNDRFRASIALQLGRSVGYLDPGRPVVKN